MATRDSRHAKAGQLGGFVESEDNLGGEAWVDNNAEVWGEAFVYCYAYVSGNARVYGRAQVYDYAWVGEDARVYDNARIYDSAYVGGHAEVHGQTEVEGMAAVKDEAEVTGHARVVGWAKIGRRAFIEHLCDYCVFQGFGWWKDCPLTVFREKNGEVGVLFEYYSETLEDFTTLIGDAPIGRTFRAIIEVIKLHFNLN